ncbi:MAG: hypothetical protein IJ880_03420 [Bacilli bacterium]|nr:hypothetical protein [Bacilli bacterium]
MDKELLEKLHESGSMFLLLVSLISSDTLTDLEACEESKKTTEEILAILPEVNIPEEDKKKYEDYLKRGLEIIERDGKEFKSRSSKNKREKT